MAPNNSISLNDVIIGLRKIFEDDHVSVEEVNDLLESYKSDPADWTKYAKWDPMRYTRNLVDTGNGKYNLMLVCWCPGTESAIHDHQNSHCFVKVMDGKLKETRFDWPKEEGAVMPVKEVIVYDLNGISYMSDQLGLHRMGNASETETAVTLHVYIPAIETCYMFDERTAHKSKCKVTFWSKYGQKVEYKITGNDKNNGDTVVSSSTCYATIDE